jgi:hypothetical protein
MKEKKKKTRKKIYLEVVKRVGDDFDSTLAPAFPGARSRRGGRCKVGLQERQACDDLIQR